MTVAVPAFSLTLISAIVIAALSSSLIVMVPVSVMLTGSVVPHSLLINSWKVSSASTKLSSLMVMLTVLVSAGVPLKMKDWELRALKSLPTPEIAELAWVDTSRMKPPGTALSRLSVTWTVPAPS